MSIGRVYEDVLTDAIYNPVKKLAQNWPIFAWHYPFKHIWELFLWANVTREYFENLFPTITRKQLLLVHESRKARKKKMMEEQPKQKGVGIKVKRK